MRDTFKAKGSAPSMSRRHFEAIARILSASHTQPVEYQRDYIEDQLAIMCGQYNAAFDYDRFVAACAP